MIKSTENAEISLCLYSPGGTACETVKKLIEQ